jgi:hypothetical protein
MLTYVNITAILFNIKTNGLVAKMTKRAKHPNKEIEEAIAYAEKNGWIYKSSGKSAHAWGRLLCPLHTREGHQMSIWSTPRNAFNHSQQIKRLVNQCQHDATEDYE